MTGSRPAPRGVAQWLVPAVLGVAAAVGGALVAPHVPHAPAASPVLLPFTDAGHGARLLVIARVSAPDADAALPAYGLGPATWWTGHVGVASVARPNATAPACPCVDANHTSAVRATVYVVESDGSVLAATNGTDLGSLRRADGFTWLPDSWWHVGPGPLARDERPLPPSAQALLDRVRPALSGLGAGDVAVAWVPDPPHADLLGPLAITVRVDAVRPAPAPGAAASTASGPASPAGPP